MRNPFVFAKFMKAAGQFSPVQVLSFIYHVPNFFRLFHRLMKDPRVPFHLKSICYFSLFYFIWPIDLLKDLPFFFIGYADDIFILIWAFRKLVKESPPEVVQEHVEAISAGR